MKNKKYHYFSKGFCLNIIDIFSLDSPDLPFYKKLYIIDHVYSCPTCRVFFDDYKLFSRKSMIYLYEAKYYAQISPHSHKRFFQSPFLPNKPVFLFFSFVIICSFLFSLLLRFLPKPVQSIHASDTRSIPEIQTKIIAPAQFSIVKKKVLRFDWISNNYTDQYSISIFDENLLNIYESEYVSNTHFLLNEDIKYSLKSNKVYFWSIKAKSSATNTSESKLFPFIIID